MTDPGVVAVTGASSGIGRATALAFGAAGWNVACGARRGDRVDEVVAAITAAGGLAFGAGLDVTSASSVTEFFDTVSGELGRLDAVICNAGISIPGCLADLDPGDLRRVIDTNLVGTALCAQAALRVFRHTECPGHIVFISSDAVQKPYPNMLPYGASKAGLEYIAEGLRAELVDTGTRVSTVRLGPTETEFGDRWPGRAAAELWRVWERHAVLPTDAVLTVDDVAEAIVAVVSAPHGIEFRLVSIGPTARDAGGDAG